MGAGSSQQAPFTLLAKVPAGTYHCVLDAVILADVTMTFALIWRHGPGSGTSDTVLVQWTESYQPLAAGPVEAEEFAYDEPAPAIDPEDGDQFVFSYTANGSSQANCYAPNGDGSNGQDPSITLPK